jgi:hypothetical protein
MLKASPDTRSPEKVRRYFKPSLKAIAECTSLLALGDPGR